MAPKLGQIVKVYGHDCRIIAILPMGTIEVERLDGSRYYRLSWLRTQLIGRVNRKG